jgi:hypothetical protein
MTDGDSRRVPQDPQRLQFGIQRCPSDITHRRIFFSTPFRIICAILIRNSFHLSRLESTQSCEFLFYLSVPDS